MSKKTHKKPLKKSSKTPVGRATKARATAATKKPAAKKRSAVASQPVPTISKKSKPPAKTTAKNAAKTITKPVAKSAAPKASHRGASKPLTLPAAPKSNPATAKPKASAAKISAATAGNAALMEGIRAPAFDLPRDGGDTVSLADFAGRKLVLFFYPRADTPGCTREAIDFTRLADAFADAKTAVLGVSADPLKTQEAFRAKHDLTVPLISDEHHHMLEAYGAWGEKSMYGKTFHGVLRTTVLVGSDGRVIKIWRHVKVDGHADEVLAAAQAA